MAHVAVRTDDYEDGAVPAVCVATGEPADVLVEHHSRAGAGAWVLLLLLLGPVGIVAMIVVDRLLSREAQGLVPMTRAALAEAKARRRRWEGVALVALAVAVAAAVLAVAVAGLRPGAWVAALLAGAVAVTLYLTPGRLGVTGRPDRRGRTVTLDGVAPAFARAYRAQDAMRAEARRRAMGTATTAPLLR